MIFDGFGRLQWGFFFLLISFRIQGFDVIPDIVGYVLLADGAGKLASESEFFETAHKFALPMIFISLFDIYKAPVQQHMSLNYPSLGPMSIMLGLVSGILTLVIAYTIFMGVKDMAEERHLEDIADEAERRWGQFLLIYVASLFLFVLIGFPTMAFVVAVGVIFGSIALAIATMNLMQKCEETFPYT